MNPHMNQKKKKYRLKTNENDKKVASERTGEFSRFLALLPDQKATFHCEDGFMTYEGKVAQGIYFEKDVYPVAINPATGKVMDSVIEKFVCS